MQLEELISNLKTLLINFSDDINAKQNTNLTNLFNSLNLDHVRKDIDSFSEIVLLVASLFELKAKSLIPQNENVDWLDEIQLIKDKDLAFARLLQFKAFSEVGIALASRIRENETSISAFKYYQTLNLYKKPDIEVTIDINNFNGTAEEVFQRYKSIKGFDHIEYDLPDIDQAINDLLSKVDKKLNTSFEELVSEVDSSEKAVAVFLALLEAIRWGFVKAEQLNNNDLIKIEKNYEQ